MFTTRQGHPVIRPAQGMRLALGAALSACQVGCASDERLLANTERDVVAWLREQGPESPTRRLAYAVLRDLARRCLESVKVARADLGAL